MDTQKLLTADLLDIVFDDRNKAYGAYELRRTYEHRIKKSLFITGGILVLTFSGVVLANKFQPHNRTQKEMEDLITIVIPPIDEIEKPIEPPKPVEPPEVRTVKLTDNIRITTEPDVDPPPTVADLEVAAIGLENKPGNPDDGTQPASTAVGDVTGVIENKKPVEDDVWSGPVEIEAKFNGSWEKFLTRNLRGEVPVDNNAPAGRYTVLIQFVVSLDGTINDIKPLTNNGYGLEEEAMRVLRKAEKWTPAIQNGRQVKAYRRQPITFVVED